MAMIEPDFSQEFKPLEPGQYTARVKSYETKTSQKGDRYIRWKLDVLDHDGATVDVMTMLEGRGAGMIKSFLKNCDGAYDGGPFDPDTYIGSRIGIEVIEAEFNGKKKAEVKKTYMVDASAEKDVQF